jgi:iron complex outermembrane receptor protein
LGSGRGRGFFSPRRLCAIAAGVVISGLAGAACGQDQPTGPAAANGGAGPSRVEDLRDLSIDQLAQIQVTSVAKSPEPLSDAPAAIYVITHDDIIRSGAISLPEILRLAPNLDVVQTSASSYIITARGFSGDATAQNFTNKLLVLIDGRSVYTPLYSGVYWDVQDVPPEDIERIEVISGPGATLWGANAVNGVINIITRPSSQTQGGLIDVAGGSLGTSVGVQYGGRIGDDLSYRVYAKSFTEYHTVTASGARADDAWSKPQGGFRLDWTPTAVDSVTFQGDAYSGEEAQAGEPDQYISGGDIETRWTHAWQDGSSLQVQAYYDQTDRGTPEGNGHFTLDTYDLDVQDSFAPDARNELVFGGGLRFSRYSIAGAAALLFAPPSRWLDLSNAFVQDTFSVTPTLKLIAGLKLEDDPYSGLSVLPDLRLSWKPIDQALLWAAVSRAIRSPTPFDRDVVEKIGPIVYLIGGPDFQPETLTAYESGARVQVTPRLSFSISGYYNAYDDLKTIEPAPSGFIPLRWGNMMRGDTYGFEAWGEYRVTPWWRLVASFDDLEKRLSFKPGASGLLGVAQAGDDPEHQASLKSSMDLPHNITLDADLRYVSALPDPALPAYVELNSRIGWNINDHVQLSLSGFNLLHAHHLEFPASEANAVPRSVLAELRLRF